MKILSTQTKINRYLKINTHTHTHTFISIELMSLYFIYIDISFFFWPPLLYIDNIRESLFSRINHYQYWIFWVRERERENRIFRTKTNKCMSWKKNSFHYYLSLSFLDFIVYSISLLLYSCKKISIIIILDSWL